ncbi:TetR family transcriptional regulator C-terminal domain-containing protein [Microbacterium barkeri]|uniref:TetR/AcrR family transcriptional regulator n=1 Tax=Microbacterium barkeri TaxID=33917 RepID=UPI0024AF5336|nr:TetR/AcrR family transcriptional regulator [Microbacterium barkeri]MDI6943965.1 TetR family transcriptional regulator C-terminal domain-containing protein [Microbacterium barkeri]
MARTRELVVEAAIALLGEEGMRSFTHRRVDRRAGLPEGSTSNYFRTREALLAGVVDGIVASELDTAEPLPGDPDAFVDALAGMVEFITGPRRTHTIARHALFLEASHDPELSAKLSSSRERYVAVVSDAVARLGAPDPDASAAAVMSVCEGLILHRIARGDTSDPRPAIAVAIRGALAG